MKTSENKVAKELNQSRQTFNYWKKERPEVYNTIRGYYELKEELANENPDIDALKAIIENVNKTLGNLTGELETTTIKDLAKRYEEAPSDKAKIKVLSSYAAALKKYPKWENLKKAYQEIKAK